MNAAAAPSGASGQWDPRSGVRGGPGSVCTAGAGAPKEEPEEQETERLEGIQEEQRRFWKPRAGPGHPGAAVSLASAVMPPGARLGGTTEAASVALGTARSSLEWSGGGRRRGGCGPSQEGGRKRGGAVVKTCPRESPTGRWPRVSGVEGGAEAETPGRPPRISQAAGGRPPRPPAQCLTECLGAPGLLTCAGRARPAASFPFCPGFPLSVSGAT